jgi:hypothetical protein
MPEVLLSTAVRAIGARAAAALADAGGRLAPLADFPRAPYMRAGREIVWVGHEGPMHPRAIFLTGPADVRTRLLDVPAPWSAPRTALSEADGRDFRDHVRAMLPALVQSAPASGLAALLAGRAPLFPLAARAAACHRAGRAARAGDPAAFAAAAATLLGAGLGLTPSGDDFVGAAVFTLRALHPRDARWAEVGAQLAALAASRTHAIGVALFTDLTLGQSFAPLHDMFAARDLASCTRSANALADIGHSSGRDMLAGIVAAAIGLPPLLNRTNEPDAP